MLGTRKLLLLMVASYKQTLLSTRFLHRCANHCLWGINDPLPKNEEKIVPRLQLKCYILNARPKYSLRPISNACAPIYLFCNQKCVPIVQKSILCNLQGKQRSTQRLGKAMPCAQTKSNVSAKHARNALSHNEPLPLLRSSPLQHIPPPTSLHSSKEAMLSRAFYFLKNNRFFHCNKYTRNAFL